MSVNVQGGLSGATSGAAIGSQIMPGWGTAIGAIGGGLLGLFGGGGGRDVDPMAMWREQTAANRPDQFTPFAFSDWSQGPDGGWQQTVDFKGPLGDASRSLQAQWAKNAASGYGTGWDAYDKAFGAAWGSAKGALDPIWSQREAANQSSLINQGLDMGSEIYQTQTGNLNDQRARDYQRAIEGAVGQGFGAQGQMFNQNRQAWMDPLQALGGMQGLLKMPDFVPASNPPYAAELANSQYKDQQQADLWSGLGDLGVSLAGGGGNPFSLGGGGGGGQTWAPPYQPGMQLDPGAIFGNQMPFSFGG